MQYIGIDLGTSSVKLLLVDEAGHILRSVSEKTEVCHPKDGWSEQNPVQWTDAAERLLDALLSDIDRTKIGAVAVAGQMHGLVALDQKNRVLRPAILWNDGRAAEQTAWLNQTVGEKRLIELTGNIAFAGFTAPKLLWMKENEPDLFRAIKKILLPKDYLTYWLTGRFSTDVSDASGTLLFDVEHRCWSKPMMEICSVDSDQLPKVYESAEVVGCIRKELAERFGLHPRVKVCAGAGDNAAAAIGCGVIGSDRCNISIGTSGTVFLSSNSFGSESAHSVHSFDHADGGYHRLGCILSAAACNTWWMNMLESADFEKEQAEISSLGTNGVYFLPYLMGERSPHNDTEVRGSFMGLSMTTTRKDMTLAVLEGVAFAIRDCIEAACVGGSKPSCSLLCGGGAKSPLWQKIIANVLGMTLILPTTEQGPAYGAAILGAAANGEFESITSRKALQREVAETAFSESVLTILPALRTGQWQLMHSDGTPVVRRAPTLPLTLLEKRWLKAVAADPRAKLFPAALPPLDGIEPLFTGEDYRVYDRYGDGDPYENEDYLWRFRRLLQAIKGGTPVAASLKNRHGHTVRTRFVPAGLEYSEKDDKFRVRAADGLSRQYNLARLLSCEHDTADSPVKADAPRVCHRELVLEICDERNAPERAMLHFAHFEKRAERIDETHYMLHLKYDESDETKIVIRVLSFGPYMKVRSPEGFAVLIRQRLAMQQALALPRAEACDS